MISIIYNINIFQVVIAVIAVWMIVSGVFKFYRKEKGQTFLKFAFVLSIWTMIMFFALFPEQSRELSRRLGMGESLNTLIFLVFVVIFLILFKIINIIEKIERNISEIVREEALESIKTKKEKK